jgi:uncharacterized membrane protein
MRHKALHIISAGLCGMALIALLMLALINTSQMPPLGPLAILAGMVAVSGAIFWRTR